LNPQPDPALRPNLLVAGVGPLPPERPERLFAPGLRIWGIARELAKAGHCVRLVCAPFGQDGLVRRYDLAPQRDPVLCEGDNFTLQSGELPTGSRAGGGFPGPGRRRLDRPDEPRPGPRRARLPIWMDYFGDPMAERQMLALRLGSDDGLARQWALLVRPWLAPTASRDAAPTSARPCSASSARWDGSTATPCATPGPLSPPLGRADPDRYRNRTDPARRARPA